MKGLKAGERSTFDLHLTVEVKVQQSETSCIPSRTLLDGLNVDARSERV